MSTHEHTPADVDMCNGFFEDPSAYKEQLHALEEMVRQQKIAIQAQDEQLKQQLSVSHYKDKQIRDLQLRIEQLQSTGLPATTAEGLHLQVTSFEAHDNAPINNRGPPVPCTASEKPINVVLELVDSDGALTEPPKDFWVKADLCVEGDPSPLDGTDVEWCRRSNSRSGRKEHFMTVGIGTKNVFMMPTAKLELVLKINVYSSEAGGRKLCVQFRPWDDSSTVSLARSISVWSMSRVPCSRKQKRIMDLPEAEAEVETERYAQLTFKPPTPPLPPAEWLKPTPEVQDLLAPTYACVPTVE